MDNIKKIAIVFGILFLFIAGSVFYALYQVEQAEDQGYKRGYTEGQANIKPVETKIETVKTTVYIKNQKPKPVIQGPDADSALIEFVNSMIVHADDLEQRLKYYLEPKEFFIADTLAHAVIRYFPPQDYYEGYIEHAQINTEITKVKEPLPVDKKCEEAWYEDPSLYVAGGATAAVVIGSGGTVLVGVGATVIIGGIIAIF